MAQCHTASSKTITDECSPSGYCQQSLFSLQYDHADIQKQLQYVLVYLAEQLYRFKPSLALVEIFSPDFALRYRAYIRNGLYLSLSKLMQQTALLNVKHVHKKVLQQLLTNSMMSCAYISRE
jgi:hypothetical protein